MKGIPLFVMKTENEGAIHEEYQSCRYESVQGIPLFIVKVAFENEDAIHEEMTVDNTRYV